MHGSRSQLWGSFWGRFIVAAYENLLLVMAVCAEAVAPLE